TLLGAEQKAWLIEAIRSSRASWKIIGNDLQMAQQAVDLERFDKLPAQYRAKFYFSVDQWDGYRSERAEIFQALSGVKNLVSVAGDIHAFYAGELHVDFDDPSRPVAVEFVVAGITSSSLQEETASEVASNPTLSALGLGDLVPLTDRIIAETNPHNVYADS